MSSITKRTLVVGAVGALATVGVGGAAFAANGSHHGVKSNTGSAAASPRTGELGGIRKLLLRTDHASLEVKVKGTWETVTLDRGKVSAISSTSITLARPDGQNVTETIGSTTKFRGVTSASAVVIGKGAIVISMSGSAVTVAQRAGTSTSGTASLS
jgi:hypothetical protein